MPDNVTASGAESDIANIDTIVFEHEAIRHHMVRLNRFADEEEALFVQRTGEWTPSQIETLREKQVNLENYLITLHEGITRHEALEERAMPRLIGDLLMAGLRMEHRDMRGQAGKAEALMSLIEVQKLSREETLARVYGLRGALETLRKMVADHLAKEEFMLALAKRVIESEQAKPAT